VTRKVRAPLGLIGQIVGILLLTLLIEFAISTLLYERASQFSVRDDEARRLAEHLVISRRLISERSANERPAMARDLTTDRYAVRWEPSPRPAPPLAPSLDGMREQILAWEPSLAGTGLFVRIASPGRSSKVSGAFRLDDRSWVYFDTLEPVHGLNLATERVLLALIPAAALMLLGGLLVGRVLRPLRALAAAADSFGSGSEAPVAEQGPADVARVIGAFNRMQARIQALIADRTQALAAVGHDFRTPLARLRLRAEGISEPDTREAIATDIAEMEAMVSSLLAYLGGEEDPEEPVRTDVAVLCATVVDDAVDHGLDARYLGPVHLEARVRPLALKRAVANLVDNALKYGSEAVVTLANGGNTLDITVEDNGPGLPEDMLRAVLEPFVRLDVARPRDTIGFGLGLAIVARVVERENGEFALRNRSEGGLAAHISLPRSS
jgi:signal transduction histidine kinase